MSAHSRLAIKVVPGASRDKIAGWLGEALKIRVKAPPEKGKANAAVIALLEQALELPGGSVSICSGHTAQTKTVEVQGLSKAQLANRLAQIIG